MLRIIITHNVADVRMQLNDIRVQRPEAMLRGTKAAVMMVVAHTAKTKLTEAGPRYLNVKTGNLRRSALSSPKFTMVERSRGVGVVGTWGTKLEYGVKHERGGVYDEQVPAHLRRIRRRLSSSGRDSAERRLRSGFSDFDRPGPIPLRVLRQRAREMGVAYVKAHTRVRSYRARHMFEHGFDEKSAQVRIPIDRSMYYLVHYGRLASPTELSEGL